MGSALPGTISTIRGRLKTANILTIRCPLLSIRVIHILAIRCPLLSILVILHMYDRIELDTGTIRHTWYKKNAAPVTW